VTFAVFTGGEVTLAWLLPGLSAAVLWIVRIASVLVGFLLSER
jgi:hypothetical protein